MPTVDVHTGSGDVTGTVDLDDALFGAPVNVSAMHEVVSAQLAAARAGTAKVRNRAAVRGGGSKPWRQKGTGRARQGSIRAPQWTGGAVAHGPTGEQNHVKRVNKKLRRLALRSALSDRTASGDVRVVEGLAFDRPRTKAAAAALDALGLAGRHVLLVLAGWDDDVTRSFRNLPDVHVLTVDQLNTYDVLRSDVVVFQREALEHVGTGRRADLPAASAGGEGQEAP
ncbi:MAG: 50S ribosomal protein L4 [Actinomycetota bacterium]|nr:50S ribosomal protein L4 [Actinomycetota bacterium]